jgi:hypothetical protein
MSELARVDFMGPTLTVGHCMWNISFGFFGSRLDLETIKEDPLGHYIGMKYDFIFHIDHVDKDLQYAL